VNECWWIERGARVFAGSSFLAGVSTARSGCATVPARGVALAFLIRELLLIDNPYIHKIGLTIGVRHRQSSAYEDTR
jgi:hypothetical protein